MAGSVSASARATPPAPDVPAPPGNVTPRALGRGLCHVPMLQGALVGCIGWASRGDCATISCDKPHQTPRPGPQPHAPVVFPLVQLGTSLPCSKVTCPCPLPPARCFQAFGVKKNLCPLPALVQGGHYKQTSSGKWLWLSLTSQSAQARGVGSSMSHPKQEGSSMGDMGPLSRGLPAPSPGAS